MAISTESIFAAIEQNDLETLIQLFATDPMLVHARRAKSDSSSTQTTLQFAAEQGLLEVCKLLVEHGAEVYTNPMNTYPPVMEASWNDHQAVVDYFLHDIPEKADGTNGLGVAINLAGRRGWTEIVRKHVARDPLSVYQRGWIGDSPLHWPAHNDNVEICTILLDAGASTEADETNCYGGKPLHWASEHAPKTVELLLSRGAQVDSRNIRSESQFFGMTPLIMNATQHNDCSEVTELLLGAGADINATDAQGLSAIDHALRLNLVRITEVLQKHTGRP